MFRTFNMGIGLVMVVAPKDVDQVRKQINPSYVIGSIERGSKGVRFV